MIALAAALAAAQAPAPFAPVLDKPYRVTVEEAHTTIGGLWHFRQERLVVFQSEADGLRVTITLVTLGSDAPGEVGRRFLLAAGALKGRPVIFHLTHMGEITAVDDQAAVWAAVLEGIAAMAPKPQEHAPDITRRPAAPFVGMSSEQARATLGSTLTAMVAGRTAAQASGTRPVSLPARAPGGGAEGLSGTETVTSAPDGSVRVVTHAQSPAGVGVARALDRTAVLDPAHGLVISVDERQVTTLGSAEQVILSHMQVAAPVS